MNRIKHTIPFWVLPIYIFFFNCSSDDSQISVPIIGDIDEVKTFGGTKNEGADSVTKTNDGGFAVLGFVQSMDGDVSGKTNESFDYWVLKFDVNNTLQWNKAFGGSTDDRGKQIIQTSDGGYAIIGYSQSADGDVTENAGIQDYWIAKLDATGNLSWQKSFGFLGADIGYSILQSNDDGYLITGTLDVTASGGQGNSRSARRHAGGDYWAIKLDANGDKQWSRYYGGTFTDTPYDAIQTDDDGFIIVGSSDSQDVDISNSNGSYDFWVIKISSSGDLIWGKSYGGSEIDEAHAISKSNDGNYIVVGDTRSSDLDVLENNGAADLWVIKISSTGDLIWERTYGGSSFDVGRDITNTQDNGFLITGSSRSSDGDLTTNNGQNDAWVLKIDTNGNLEWQKTVGGSEIDFGYGVAELNDRTITVVGDSSSSDNDIVENKGFTDLLVVKLK